jgi:general secretion pathway protein D
VLCVGSESAADAQQVEGVRLDFQDVELSIVISALADAGNFNVVYTDLPSRRVTLRMNQPVPRDQILPLLRSIAASNGLRVVEDGPLLRVEPIEPGALGPEEGTVEGPPIPELRMFVYRLKHARAPRLASTLQAMFGGGSLAGGAPTSLRQPSSERLRGQRVPPTELDQPRDVAVQLGEQAQPGLPGELQGDVIIVPDEPTNSLLVRSQPGDWEILQQAIEALDLRPLQVLIEVVIAEVRRTTDFDLGVTGDVTRTREGETGTTVGGRLEGLTAGDVVLQLMQAGPVDVNVTLAALSANGNVRVLSRPVVLAQNNQEARILVGSERPFIQVFRSLPTETAVRDQIIQYRDVGTSLTIVPTINEDGYVNLQVVQEVSTATAEEQFGAPVISTRETSTQLFVKDGQTVVLGGLVEEQEEETRSGVPLLKDIPLLGLLFGSTQRSTSAGELYMFLTPHIIASDDDAERLRQEIERQGQLPNETRRDTLALVPQQRWDR